MASSVNIKELREKFDKEFAEFAQNYKKGSFYHKDTFPNFIKVFPPKEESLSILTGPVTSAIVLFSGYKSFYVENNLKIPKSMPVYIGDSMLDIIKESKIENRIFNRFKENVNLIKSSYINKTNLNFISYCETTNSFYGLTYAELKKQIFNLYITLNREINYELKDIAVTFRVKGDIHLTDNVTAKGTLRYFTGIPIKVEKISTGKVLTGLFDIVKAHEAEALVNSVQTFEASKKKLIDKFCVVRGNLIDHYYREKNYTKDKKDTLHGSCMRNSDSIKFYALFPDKIGMLSLFDKIGKLKGRALLWTGREIPGCSDMNETIWNKIKNNKEENFIDRIYYDSPETYNLFVAYAKTNNLKSSYANSGLEQKRVAVELQSSNPLKAVSFLKNSPGYPYMDSFAGIHIIGNSLHLSNTRSREYASNFEEKMTEHYKKYEALFTSKNTSDSYSISELIYRAFRAKNKFLLKIGEQLVDFEISALKQSTETPIKVTRAEETEAEKIIKKGEPEEHSLTWMDFNAYLNARNPGRGLYQQLIQTSTRPTSYKVTIPSTKTEDFSFEELYAYTLSILIKNKLLSNDTYFLFDNDKVRNVCDPGADKITGAGLLDVLSSAGLLKVFTFKKYITIVDMFFELVGRHAIIGELRDILRIVSIINSFKVNSLDMSNVFIRTWDRAKKGINTEVEFNTFVNPNSTTTDVEVPIIRSNVNQIRNTKFGKLIRSDLMERLVSSLTKCIDEGIEGNLIVRYTVYAGDKDEKIQERSYIGYECYIPCKTGKVKVDSSMLVASDTSNSLLKEVDLIVTTFKSLFNTEPKQPEEVTTSITND